MQCSRTYFICSSPRSGSSLLASGIGATGVAGIPREWFSFDTFAEEVIQCRELNLRDQRAYLSKVIEQGATPNGVFGAKVHASHTLNLLAKLEDHNDQAFSSLYQALETTFPDVRFIYLSRGDKVKQAVSFYRALITGQWARTYRRGSEPFFDQYGIKRCLAMLQEADAYWEGFFSAHSLLPLRLTYETLAERYEECVRESLEYLGLPPPDVIAPPVPKKQADELSLAWEREFIAREAREPILLSSHGGRRAPY